jgi:hypothetical protein
MLEIVGNEDEPAALARYIATEGDVVVHLQCALSVEHASNICAVLTQASSIELHVLDVHQLNNANLDDWLRLNIVSLYLGMHERNNTSEWTESGLLWQYIARTTTVIELSASTHKFMHVRMREALCALAANRSIVDFVGRGADVEIEPDGMRAFANAVAARPWPISLQGTSELFCFGTELAPVVADMLRRNLLSALTLHVVPTNAPELVEALSTPTALADLYVLNGNIPDSVAAAVDYCVCAHPNGSAVHADAAYIPTEPFWQLVSKAPLTTVQKAVFHAMLRGRGIPDAESGHCFVSARRLFRALDYLVDDIGIRLVNLVDAHGRCKLDLLMSQGRDEQHLLTAWRGKTMQRLFMAADKSSWPEPLLENYAELCDVVGTGKVYADTGDAVTTADVPFTARCADGDVDSNTAFARMLRKMSNGASIVQSVIMPDFVRTDDFGYASRTNDVAELVRRVRAANYLELIKLGETIADLWAYMCNHGLLIRPAASH